MRIIWSSIDGIRALSQDLAELSPGHLCRCWNISCWDCIQNWVKLNKEWVINSLATSLKAYTPVYMESFLPPSGVIWVCDVWYIHMSPPSLAFKFVYQIAMREEDIIPLRPASNDLFVSTSGDHSNCRIIDLQHFGPLQESAQVWWRPEVVMSLPRRLCATIHMSSLGTVLLSVLSPWVLAIWKDLPNDVMVHSEHDCYKLNTICKHASYSSNIAT